MNTETEQARADLDTAREAHAAAFLARLDAPNDPNAQRRLQDTVQQGKQAWKGYQSAATAGLAQQIEGIVPTAFPDDNSPDVPAAFREE